MGSDHEPNDTPQPLQNLKSALSQCCRELESSSPGFIDRSTTLHNLGAALHAYGSHWPQPAYGEPGFEEALAEEEEAVECFRHALQLFPLDHAERANALHQLVNNVGSRGWNMHNVDDLDEAIQYAEDLLQLRPVGNSEHPSILQVLARLYFWSYCVQEEAAALENAIDYGQQALEIGEYDGVLPLESGFLLSSLVERYKRTGRTEDLRTVNEYYRQHLKFAGCDVPSDSCSDPANSTECFEEAIQLHHRQLDLQPADDPDRPLTLANLSTIFQYRFGHLNNMDDINEAVQLSREAYELDHYDRTLGELSDVLLTRFRILGQMDDIEEVIRLRREALQIFHGSNRTGISRLLYGLGAAVFERFDLLHNMDDLDEVIQLLQEALGHMPINHPLEYRNFSSLAHLLHARYKETQQEADLDQALDLHSQVLKLLPPGEPDPNPSLEVLARVVAAEPVPVYGTLDDLITEVRYFCCFPLLAILT